MVFKDLLQTGLTYVPGSFLVNGVSTADPNLVTGYSIGSLDSPEGSVTLQFQAKINAYPLVGDSYVNAGTVDYTFTPCLGNDIALVAQTNEVDIIILPIANPDFGTTPENTPLNGPSVLANDIGNGLMVVSYTQSENGGTVVVNPDGTYTYTPPTGFVGMDVFTYTAEDSSGNFVTTTVTITVTPLNPNPPHSFKGHVSKCDFLNKSKYFLEATWKPSTSPDILSYRVYYHGKVIATIPATSSLRFSQCLSSKDAADHYEIAAVNSSNKESKHIKIRITHE